MKKIRSNRRQIEKLVHLMEHNPDLARGQCPKPTSTMKWKRFTAELNSLGPPTRTPEKWAKVWTDLKFKTKKRNFENKQKNAYLMNAVEDSLVAVLDSYDDPLQEDNNMNAALSTSNSSRQPASVPDEPVVSDHEEGVIYDEDSLNCDYEVKFYPEEDFEEFIEADAAEEKTSSRKTQGPTSKVPTNDLEKKTNIVSLLEEQTKAQENFHKSIRSELGDIKTSLRNIKLFARKTFSLEEETNKELLEIKREKLKIYREEAASKQKYRLEKLKILQKQITK